MGIGVGCSCFCGRQTIAEYDPETGERVWKWGQNKTTPVAIGRATYSLMVDEDRQCLIAQGTIANTAPREEVILFDGLHTPSKRWASQNDDSIGLSSGIATLGNLPQPFFPVMSPSGDLVYVSGSLNGNPVVIDAEDGAILARAADNGPHDLFALSDDSANYFRIQFRHMLSDGSIDNTFANSFAGRPTKIGDRYWIRRQVFEPPVTSRVYWSSVGEDLTTISDEETGVQRPGVSTGYSRVALCRGKTGVLCLRSNLASGADPAHQYEWMTGATAAWTKTGEADGNQVQGFIGNFESTDYLYFRRGTGIGTGAAMKFEKWSKATGALVWSKDYFSGSGADQPGHIFAYAVNSSDVIAIVHLGAMVRDEDGFLRIPWLVSRLDAGTGDRLWSTRWSWANDPGDGLIGRSRAYGCTVTEAGNIFVCGELTVTGAREAD